VLPKNKTNKQTNKKTQEGSGWSQTTGWLNLIQVKYFISLVVSSF
jgi:hypothetical protein